MIRELKNTFAAIVCAFALGACASNDAMETKSGAMDSMVINETCPMMDTHAVDPEVTVDYNGHKVGFCCEKCIAKWDKWSDEQKAAYVENSKK